MQNSNKNNFINRKENSRLAVKVLHVDNDMSFLNVSKKILNILGNFEIDSVTSVMEAKKALEYKQYDVIICEYCIDNEKGLEFLAELRTKGNNITFLMFSIDEEIADKARKMGVTQFLSKNGNPEKVFTDLSNSINSETKTIPPF